MHRVEGEHERKVLVAELGHAAERHAVAFAMLAELCHQVSETSTALAAVVDPARGVDRGVVRGHEHAPSVHAQLGRSLHEPSVQGGDGPWLGDGGEAEHAGE